jgi:cell division protein FtsW (lipid II flippase)
MSDLSISILSFYSSYLLVARRYFFFLSFTFPPIYLLVSRKDLCTSISFHSVFLVITKSDFLSACLFFVLPVQSLLGATNLLLYLLSCFSGDSQELSFYLSVSFGSPRHLKLKVHKRFNAYNDPYRRRKIEKQKVAHIE